MGEWLKPAVLKTVSGVNSLGGSNPSSSASASPRIHCFRPTMKLSVRDGVPISSIVCRYVRPIGPFRVASPPRGYRGVLCAPAVTGAGRGRRVELRADDYGIQAARRPVLHELPRIYRRPVSG